jgi:hypothetical protein
LVNRFIDHLQVVTTDNYNTIANIHTKSSQSTLTSFYLATALSNGCSTRHFRCSLVNTPQLNPELHCSASCLEDITHPHGPHRKYSPYCLRDMFTAPLPSNWRPIVARFSCRGNVFTESLPSNGSIRQSINRPVVRDKLNT